MYTLICIKTKRKDGDDSDDGGGEDDDHDYDLFFPFRIKCKFFMGFSRLLTAHYIFIFIILVVVCQISSYAEKSTLNC